jgi:two-component sensor histidine kinase
LAEAKDARIIVAYEVAGENWKLSVSVNGTGNSDLNGKAQKHGLGTSIVRALSKQLDAQLDVSNGLRGTTVSVTHAVFDSQLPDAA